MAKQRLPTYSNLYDAKVRTVSEYENPYDVSRRGTVIPGQQQPTQADLDAIHEVPLAESEYIAADPNWNQNQHTQQENENYYNHNRESIGAYDQTFHQSNGGN
tara:strand:- start:640 stop:948 length:309 start_codon:yes stop_codon:yes gene_type:complete